MSATPDSTSADSERLIADLQRLLAERDEALQRETATALPTLPLDGGGWGWCRRGG